MTSFIQNHLKFKDDIYKIGICCAIGIGISTIYNIIVNNNINNNIIDNNNKYDQLLKKLIQIEDKIIPLIYKKELIFEKEHLYEEEDAGIEF